MENMIDSIHKSLASLARNIEYVKETAVEDEIDERFEVADSIHRPETRVELEEALDLVDKIPVDDEAYTEAAEIEKILTSDHSLTFEEMIGIE